MMTLREAAMDILTINKCKLDTYNKKITGWGYETCVFDLSLRCGIKTEDYGYTVEELAKEIVKIGEENGSKFAIKITYSWGDQEAPYGNFETKEDAFEKMIEIASREAYVQNEEFDEDRTCTLYVDAFNKRINLHYDIDDEWCYYKVIKR